MEASKSDQKLFSQLYQRSDVAYGARPSPVLLAFLQHTRQSGIAFDLGAGAGRDSLALAQYGFEVSCFDLSCAGLHRLEERAAEENLESKIQTAVRDARSVDLPIGQIDLLVATTLLDHVPSADAEKLWQRMGASLTAMGVLYVEVHTRDDPGNHDSNNPFTAAPESESASQVINYFRPNQLATWAIESPAGLRILHYEERLEWDRSHGDEHLHGKAILLACRVNAYHAWFGQVPRGLPPEDVLDDVLEN